MTQKAKTFSSEVKKTIEIYVLSETYVTDKKKEGAFLCDTVRVRLIIDYEKNNYSIIPFNGKEYSNYCSNDSFKFIKTSQNYKVWEIVLKLIGEAIELGNKQLNINN